MSLPIIVTHCFLRFRDGNRDLTLDSKLEGSNEYYVRNDAKYRTEDGIFVEFVWKEDGKREGVCRRRKDDWKKERENGKLFP